MSKESREAAVGWFRAQGQRNLTDPGLEDVEFEQLRSLIGYPAFGIFWSILMNQRATAAQILSNAPLGTPERDWAAGVLQGQIRGIDQIYEMLLEVADPTDAQESSNEEQN